MTTTETLVEWKCPTCGFGYVYAFCNALEKLTGAKWLGAMIHHHNTEHKAKHE